MLSTRSRWLLTAGCLAVSATAGLASAAAAQDRCVAYGNERTDFTWRLCPAGEKYERQYLYFGVWSNFYRVKSFTGTCAWSPAKSSWLCPEKMIACSADRCRTR
jgi:hypothetical protein